MSGVAHRHPGDRRAATRHLCTATACRLLTPDRVARPADARDICRGGAGVWSATPLNPGEPLGVELAGPGMSRAFLLWGRVVHATAWSDGRWLVGCAFVRPLPASLAALLC
jgi:hypothetical protein